MSPAEDAALLLAIVRRHITTLRLGLDPAYPEEDWGFTAQQAVEARYQEGPFPLPAPREDLVARIEQLLGECQRAIEAVPPHDQRGS